MEAGTVCPLHHSPAHTLSGAPCLPSSLQPLVLNGTPRLLMVAGCPENHREAEHVPQGAAALGPCWGAMVCEWMILGQGYDGGGLRGMV